MNLNKSQPDRRVLWQALSPRQRQRLLALLARWTLRRWKARRTASPSLITPKGGHDEPDQA